MSDTKALELMKDQLKQLTETMKPMHLNMAIALAEGESQESAYKSAGGKGKDARSCANKLISTNLSISQYVSTVKAIASLESQEELIGTVSQKRQALWEVKQRCLDELKPVFEGYGEDKELMGYTFDARGVIGAISELNKMDGDLAAIVNKNEVTHKFADITDEELDKKIANLSG